MGMAQVVDAVPVGVGNSGVAQTVAQHPQRALAADRLVGVAVAVDVELPETKEAKKDAEHDVILPLPRTMHGIVRSRIDLPKSFARISISETGLHRGTAVLDRAGKFTIERVGPGPWEIKLREESGAALAISEVQQKNLTHDLIEVAIVTP